MKRALSILALALFTASSAQAQVVLLNDTFDSEFGGASKLSYNGFANWIVNGNVDLVRSPDYGITCKTGSCVDLDGTPGPGSITTKQAYSFSAGDVMRISFDLSGNQRLLGTSDNFFFGANITGSPSATSCAASFLGCLTNSFTHNETINGGAPWSNYYYEFTAAAAGTVDYTFGTLSNDNVGPLLDNVVITQTSTVPEPSTWALMASGLLALGVVGRRNRKA